MMNEYIIAPVIWSNKSKTFAVVEPLYGTCSHIVLTSWMNQLPVSLQIVFDKSRKGPLYTSRGTAGIAANHLLPGNTVYHIRAGSHVFLC
jgi:hypothetical protein